MADEHEIWIVGATKATARDLVKWAKSRGCSAVFYTADDLEGPQWQLAPHAFPALVFLDGRAPAGTKSSRVRLEEWLVLLRDRAWEAPVFLVLPKARQEDFCRWGRYGATGVVGSPSSEDLDRIHHLWAGKKDPGRGKEEIPLLSILREAGATLSASHSTADLWDRFLHRILKRFNGKTGSILLLTEEQTDLIPLAAIGLPPEVAKRDRLPLKGSVTSRVIQEDQALLLQGNLQNVGMSPGKRSSRPVSAMAVPLRFGTQVLGSLNVARVGERAKRFGRKDLLALEVVGTQTAFSIMNFRLIDQVRENERLAAVGRTTADVSHSVKNILTGLLGSMYLLEKGHETGDASMLEESLLLLQRSVSRLNLMIGDLLDFSKQRQPAPEPCQLHPIFEELQRQIAYRCEQQNVDLRLDIPDDMPVVAVEEDRLFRALMNLAGNALDAMPMNGSLEIRVRWESNGASKAEGSSAPATFHATDEVRIPGNLLIDVADRGPGVPEEMKRKIFEDFYSTKGSRGTGLGLAMVRKFIAESKGTVEVKNREGGGAVFSLLLPADVVVSL